MFTDFKLTKERWTELFQFPIFKIYFVATVTTFALVIHTCTKYITIWDTRVGVQLFDPLLNLLTPINLSIPIFMLVYSCMLTAVLNELKNPFQFQKALQAYAILLLLRTATIFLFPLEPPANMIVLRDPFIELFLSNGGTQIVVKDLFFSGHVSAMVLFTYYISHPTIKKVFIPLTFVLAIMILIQHVHYTIDVVAAPFFAIFSCKIVDRFHAKSEYGFYSLSVLLSSSSKQQYINE